MFLDPDKPIATCSQSSCAGCPVEHNLKCHFQGKDLARFFLMFFPGFLFGAVGIFQAGWVYFLPWVAFIFAYFGLIEIRVMCSHCPHYAEKGSTLQCWANYGAPRLWRYRPGPMSSMEKVVFFSGFAVMLAYPLFLLAFWGKWFLLTFFSLGITVMYLLMRSKMCNRCMNFACPLNLVDKATRDAFFKQNPVVAAAWGVDSHVRSKIQL